MKKKYSTEIDYAFPVDEACGVDTGMTLRDWFAGQVIAGLISHERAKSKGGLTELAKENGITIPDLQAKIAYSIAEAMINERNK